LLRCPQRAPISASQSILVLEYRIFLGYCVHLSPIYEAIKRIRPNMSISVATYGIGAELLRHSPFVDHVLITPDVLKDFPGALASLRRQLKERGLKPDCCLTGTPDSRSQIGLLGALACNGWRAGYAVHPAFYHSTLTYDDSISLLDNNLRLASYFGNAPEHLEPRVYFSQQDLEKARKLLEPSRKAGRRVLIASTCISGGNPTAWLDERWTETLQRAFRQLDYDIYYTGAPADANAISARIAACGGIGTSLAGSTTIGQLAAVLALGDMVLSLTTGTAHVARAVGAPIVVLGLAWEDPIQWIAQGQPQFRHLRGAPVPRTLDYRMQEISVDWAFSELEDMSRLYPPSEADREARVQASLSAVDHFLPPTGASEPASPLQPAFQTSLRR
jgi:ADP-heptose:LPS heptosyltransferase